MTDNEPKGQTSQGQGTTGAGGPERTQPRQNQEQSDVFAPFAEKLQMTPEQFQAALGALAQTMGRAQGQELVRSQRREIVPYPSVSPEGLAVDIQVGVDLNRIQNAVRPRIDTLLADISQVNRDRLKPDQMSQWLGRLQEILADPTINTVSSEQINRIFKNLVDKTLEYSMGRDELGVMTFSLTGEEIELMTSGLDGARQALEVWVSEIEKTSYSSEEETNRTFYNRYSAAIGWLPLLAKKYTHATLADGSLVTTPEGIRQAVDQLIKEYRARIHIHNMKWAIETNDWKIVQGVSNNMGSASLFEGFYIKNVSTALNLYQRYFDRYRIVYGQVVKKDKQGNKIPGPEGVALWRITPEVVAKIKQEVKDELERNAQFYGITSKNPDEKQSKTEIKNEADRAANIGLNLFSASMREGVHVARGQIAREDMETIKGYDDRYLKTREPSFQSDPNELLTTLYNPLQFGIEKWTRFGEPQKAILNKILLFLGKGDMATGRQEFNNLLNICDYFSSGWRITNIYQATEDRLKHFKKPEETKDQLQARLDSLSTGLLLQKENPFIKDDPKHPEKQGKNLEDGKERLKAAAKYRPLELLKAYGVTIDNEGKVYSTGEVQNKFQEWLKSGRLKTSGGLVVDNYVRLEEVLGRYLYPIYERATQAQIFDPETKKFRQPKDNQEYWSRIHGIDVGKAGNDATNPFDTEDKRLIINTVNEINNRGDVPKEQQLNADDLQSLYRQLQEFLSKEETIKDLATNPRQAYLYDRALYVDDAPLGKLEEKINNEIIPISVKLFTMEGGRRDPYARMWGDTASSNVVLEHGMNAMISRDPESLLKELHEAMAAQTGYAGRPPYIKFLYSIAEGWLKLAKADPLLAFVSLQNKLPFATSEFEELFGLAAPSMAPQELRQLYEKMQLILGKPTDEPGGKDIDNRIKKGLGIEGYKIALAILSKVAFLIIIFMLKQQLEEMEKEE